jgi:hypothetical protein
VHLAAVRQIRRLAGQVVLPGMAAAAAAAVLVQQAARVAVVVTP